MVPEETCLVDIARKFHPERKGMYTCWNTKLSVRDSNYGTRIGYVLGSDHYPVYLDLHDKIVGQDGVTLKLKDLLSGARDTKIDPPTLAAKYWDEYSGKQKLLSSFFGGKKAVTPSPSPTSTTAQVPATSITTALEQAGSSTLTSHPPQATTHPSPGERTVSPPLLEAPEPSNVTHPRSKRKRISPEPSSVKISEIQSTDEPAKKLEPGPSKLSTFSSQPGSSGSASKAKGKGAIATSGDVDMLLEESSPHENTEDAYYRMALELSSRQVSLPYPSSSQKQKEAGDAWKSPMASIQPPRCTVQNEVAKELTVNKPGVNKGKRFFWRGLETGGPAAAGGQRGITTKAPPTTVIGKARVRLVLDLSHNA
ncbi:Class II abasic (AP) endonuclease [Marasmius sp. AFHP31]|nr:Class II abasic (AP) endonuclease [Marasmius sp. AFHP31]